MTHLAVNGWFIDLPHTGTGRYLRQLLSGLPALADKLDITLVAPQAKLSALAPGDLPSQVRLHGTGGGTGRAAKVLFEQWGFPRACRQLQADLAHVPHWAPPLSSPVPVVVTIHDIIPVLVPDARASRLTQFYTSLVTVAARGANWIITDSEASRQDIIEFLNVDPARVSTVYLAADERFNTDARLTDEIRAKYGLPERYILYLGGFQKRKNVHQLVGAWTWAAGSIGDEIPLVIAGKLPDNPDGKMFYDLPKLAKELKVDGSVRFIGQVDDDDLPALYAGADVFAYPSIYEGFGLPVLEAMACGTPVLTTDKSSLGEVAGDACYLIPDPGDTRLMGAGLIATAINENLHDELRRKGLLQAARFSWRKTVTETLVVYDKVLSSIEQQ